MVINITCFKIPGSGFIFVASEYPSMTNKEIIQYTNVLLTQAPIRVGLVKYVPGRGYFRVDSSQNGDKFVTFPPPPPNR